MTREEKITKKKARAKLRITKRKLKDESYWNTACWHDKMSISWGRRKQKGLVFRCEMDWTSCEERGYCNGDC